MKKRKLSYLLLIVGAVLLIGGFVEAARPGGWGLGIPLGVVFIGLFAIVKVFEPSTAAFDEEESSRVAQAEKATGRGTGGH